MRAEYLFSENRYSDLHFRFTSGHTYAFVDYCAGVRPVVLGNKVQFSALAPSVAISHQALRQYLDFVFMYSSTISLAAELLPATELRVGTVVIKPGSPGHCLIIVNEGLTESGDKVYKLAEGYTQAQSIYILKNAVDGTPWHALSKDGTIRTSSYYFTTFRLGRFEESMRKKFYK